MELDIVILYLIVIFLLLWLGLKLFMASEYFSGNVGTYQQYYAMVKFNQCINQMENRLKTIRAKKAEYKPNTWHYNYWNDQENKHVSKLTMCKNQLYILSKQLSSTNN